MFSGFSKAFWERRYTWHLKSLLEICKKVGFHSRILEKPFVAPVHFRKAIKQVGLGKYENSEASARNKINLFVIYKIKGAKKSFKHQHSLKST